MGNGITSGAQLENYINKSPLKKYYKGLYTLSEFDEADRILKNSLGDGFVILWRDNHWTILYKKDGELFDFDSFNRDLIEQYTDSKTPDKQKIKESNCGQRCLKHVIKIFL